MVEAAKPLLEVPMLYQDLTEKIIAAAYDVRFHLGNGLLEKCYQNAMQIECEMRSLNAVSNVPLSVTYKGHIVGDFFADLLVNDVIIIELKAVRAIIPIHQAQLLHYLKTTGKKVGLIINFGSEKLEIKRMVN
jgi:GxxExxY protein